MCVCLCICVVVFVHVFVLSSSHPPTDLCKKNCRSQGTWAFFGTWRQALSFVSKLFFTSPTTTSALGTLVVIHLSFIFIFCFTSSHHCWYSSLSFIYLLSLSFVSSPFYTTMALVLYISLRLSPPLPVITPLYFELIGFALS